MKRVGILTSGGDCQGLNAAIRGVAKALYENFGDKVEIYGIQDGYRGLIQGNYRLMRPDDFSGILTLGGTILGTSRQPFKQMSVIGEDNVDKVKNMKGTYQKLKLNALVVLGGNGTQKTANLLSENGLNIIHLPKTIDNDITGTDVTFGFHSAVEIATAVVDGIHTTATSHGRNFLIEVMGHKVGWLTLSAGIAGGADVILLPEIPYNIDKIAEVLQERQKAGKRFSILAVAEGAISVEESQMSKKELKKARAASPYPSVVYKINAELQQRISNEIRVCVPGHFQRGGSPCAYDRVLCTKLGAKAAELIAEEKFGVMVGVVNGQTIPVPLSEVAGKLKSVPVNCDEIQAARQIGISFGD
ncbi:6-phosphofructokinase [Scatolibacter rhodanostii]|uniref:6-phosphofructokinase n=1 Tax=Scatolibacter rhodanostii TaxID=2014781 RepID=UPI000C075175|nr:ATP-dependent 6-phosphofructokinase [Scatolibacter rhodanostii]